MQTQATSPWRLLGFATLVQMGVSIVDQGLPELNGFIKDELGVSAAVAGIAVASFAFGKIFGSYAAGEAADRLGERRVIVTGALLVGVLSAIAATLPDWLIFEVLFLGGLAASTSTPAGGRLVLMAFPRRRHGLALSLRQCGIPAGGLVASVVLPWLAHMWGWRWALGIAGAMTVALALPLALAAFEGAEPGDVRHQRGTAKPTRDRNVRLITVWGFLIVTGQYTILAFLALDMHQRAGVSLVDGSLLVGLANAVGLLGRIFWGTVSDRLLWLGRKPLLLVLNGIGLATSLALLAAPRSTPLGVFIVLAGVAGFALIGYQGLWITALAEAAGPRRVGAATGFALTFTQAAIALTPPVYGFVADQAGSYRAVWGALSVALALALIPGFLVHEARDRR